MAGCIESPDYDGINAILRRAPENIQFPRRAWRRRVHSLIRMDEPIPPRRKAMTIISRRNGLAAILVGIAAATAANAAQAQASFPNRPITLVVPLPAGGTADLLCRLAADKAG